MSIRILIGADIVPTPSNEALFASGDASALLGEVLLQKMHEADFVSMNLEVPLTDKEVPIQKWGPCLRASEACIHGLKKINPHFFTLANNHIMDQGAQGLERTMALLKENGIAFAGAGSTPEEAGRAYVAQVKGMRFGFYCCAEHEFSIVSDKCSGANPYDPLESFDAVRCLKETCDKVIVLYHGGKELYRYPSPMLQKVFRKFAEAGADVVVAQHTHCVGCMEEYRGSTLVYGQGNFLFDRTKGDFWETSLLMELAVDEDSKACACTFLPLRKKVACTSLAEGTDADRILSDFYKRSEEIQQPGFIENQYVTFAEKMRTGYYRSVSGKAGLSKVGKALNKLTGNKFLRSLYPASCSPALENVLSCEAHRELFLAALVRDRMKKK